MPGATAWLTLSTAQHCRAIYLQLWLLQCKGTGPCCAHCWSRARLLTYRTRCATCPNASRALPLLPVTCWHNSAQSGNTAVSWAVANGDAVLGKLLVQHGAALNIANEVPCSIWAKLCIGQSRGHPADGPFSDAAWQCSSTLCGAVLPRGARLSHACPWSRCGCAKPGTPAQLQGAVPSYAWLDGTVRPLGRALQETGDTALTLAAAAGNLNMARLLLDHNANAELRNKARACRA
jgi:hypothetical protein